MSKTGLVRFTRGDILESGCDRITITVNTRGVAGKGIAKRWKELYPEDYLFYSMICQDKALVPEPGSVRGWQLAKTLLVFTKDDWRDRSKLKWVESILFALQTGRANRSLTLALAPLGCGCGGLSWHYQVKPMVDRFASRLAEAWKEVVVYEPF